MTQTGNTPAAELLLAAIENAKSSDRLLRAAVERSFQVNLIAGVDRTQLARRTEALRQQVSPHHLSHAVLRRIERNRLSVSRSISFRAKIHEMSEARNLKGLLRPSWRLDTKNRAYDFADAIGARRPDSDKESYKFSDVPKRFPSVLKATRATGSRGCYLMYSEDHMVHVRDGRTFSSIAELSSHAESLMEVPNNPVRDDWMWEEMILEDAANHTPARDLKFYTFYGEVVIMRESTRANGTTKAAYWDANSVQQDMGHPQDYDFHRIGFTPADVQLVSKISLQIPHPYIRIDMLRGEDGLVLGEFTPRPGNFDEFNDEWDRTLGEAWVRAESRLTEDMLRGKSFQPFLTATGLLKSR